MHDDSEYDTKVSKVRWRLVKACPQLSANHAEIDDVGHKDFRKAEKHKHSCVQVYIM